MDHSASDRLYKEVFRIVLCPPLPRERELPTGFSVIIDDVLRQQVQHGLPGTGDVAAEDIVEGVVLTDDDDDVFDWRSPRKYCGLMPTINAAAKAARPDELMRRAPPIAVG